jgi:hypothetical protein
MNGGAQEEITKPAFAPVGTGQGVLFQYPSEQLLSEIFRVMRTPTTTSNKGVKRKPIRGTERLERHSRSFRVTLAS